jgi:hypothetical protein
MLIILSSVLLLLQHLSANKNGLYFKLGLGKETTKERQVTTSELRLEQYFLCDVVMVSNARVTKKYLKVSIDKVCKKGYFLCSIFSLASQMFKIYSPSTKLSTNIWKETCGSFSLSVTC